jgi:hypothetical protein
VKPRGTKSQASLKLYIDADVEKVKGSDGWAANPVLNQAVSSFQLSGKFKTNVTTHQQLGH